MHNFNLNYKKIFFTITALTLIGFLNSCGIYKPVDARKTPPDAASRVKKNLEEEEDKMAEPQGLNTYSLARLKKMLNKVIEAEDYEKASEIRDEINKRKGK